MKICIIGEKNTNNRIGYFINALFANEEYEIIWDGRSNTNLHKFSRTMKKISDAINIMKSDVVYFSPFTHSYIGKIKLASWLKKYIIVDFYVSFYDMEINDRKKYPVVSKEAKRLKYIDRFAIIRANKIIFLNESEKNYYLKCADFSFEDIDITSKSVIIPLVLKNYDIDREELYINDVENDTFKMMWMGSYVPLHGLHKVIDACKILRDRQMKFHLTIWGTSETAAIEYKNHVNESDLNDYIDFRNDWYGKEYYYQQIHEQNLMLGIFGDSDKAKTVVANKIIDAVLNKTPILTAESTGIREFFNGDDIWICKNNPEDIADSIERISRISKDEITNQVIKAYNVYTMYFSVHAFNKSVKELIQDIRKESGIK